MASSTGTPGLASLASTSSSAPRLSGALPGNTSTAVISWESVSTTIAALWPSNRRLLLLWPWRISGSCTDIIRSRLTPSLSPLHVRPFGARSTSLEQQLPQQFRRRHNPLALLTVLRQLSLRLPRQLQQPVRVCHNLGQQRRPRRAGRPSRWPPRPSRWSPSISHIPGPGPIP